MAEFTRAQVIECFHLAFLNVLPSHVRRENYVAPPPPSEVDLALDALREAREERRRAAEAENEAFWAWQAALRRQETP